MRTTHGARDSVLPAVLRSGILAALIAAASAIAPSIAEEPQPQKAPPAGEKPAEAAPQIAPLQAPRPAPAKPVQVQVQVQGANQAIIVAPAGAAVQVQGNVQIGGNVQLNGNAFAVGADGAEVAEDTVFRDPPRELMQRFRRSETLIQERRFDEAVEQLGGILEEAEDYSAKFDEQSSTRRSLKGEAQRRIGTLPPEGRAAYELLYGAKAQRLLERSISEGSEFGLAETARRYFHTKAGYQATYLLGMQHLDHNRPLAAALCLRRLKEMPGAAAEFEPELSLKLAASWARAGVSESAVVVLNQAKAQYPSAEFSIAGTSGRWFGAGEQPQAWLAARLIPRGEAPSTESRPEQWAMFRGDAARNAVGNGGSPLLNRRWAVPFANHPDIEKLIEHLRKNYSDLDADVLPATHPLAVDDVVLMRTLTGLTAVDFRTGKRVWRGADDEFAEDLLTRESPLARGRGEQDPNQLMLLVDERLWRDAAYGTFSSDERAAYCVEAPSNMQRTNGVNRTLILANGRRIMPGENGDVGNRLAAYELATQGKLLWEIGGGVGSETDPSLEGTFFLGAPLPLGDRLYVLGELRGEIRLIVLDAKTGKLDWAQQLALANDPMNAGLRHTSGLSPSYADGVLICPTLLGAVVAVDLNDRSLLWGFQYPRQGNRYNHGFMAFQINGRQSSDEANRWQDATVALADGRAYLTPPESDKLFCVNQLDGKLLWKQERGQGLYLACVAGDVVVAVASNEVRGYAAADGKLKWTLPLPDGAKPSGRGFYNGKSYFLPLSTAEVAAVDIEQGRFVGRSKSRSGSIPGNLICYRGAIISQGTGGLECFFQLEDLRRDVKNKLAAKPDDPAALASSGELLLDEGKIAEAVETLRRSYRLKSDLRTRNLFLDALLEGLGAGIAVNGGDLEDLEKLALGTDKEELYLRQRAMAHEKAGDVEQALAQYLRLIDATNLSDEPIRIGQSNVSIRRELWVRSRLDALARRGPEAAKVLAAEIERRRETALASADGNQMRRFLDYFGDHPAADQLRLELAALVRDKSPLEAENLLRHVAAGQDAEAARKAALQVFELLVGARPDEAADYLENWRRERKVDAKAVADALASITRNLTGTSHDWPLGRVEVEEIRSTTGISFRQFPLEFRGGRGPYLQDVVIEMDQPTQSLVAHDYNGVERWRISLAEPNRRGTVNQFNPIVTHLRVDGHVLIVSLGHEIVAVDMLGTGAKGASRILWRHDLNESVSGINVGNVPQVHLRNVQMNWGVQRFFAQTPDGTPIGTTGPATLRYASYLKRRALYVVDPLTGKTLWVRHDIDPASEVFGDEMYLFVSPPSGEQAMVLNAADGEQIKTVKLPKAEERVMSLGRKLVSWRFEGRKAHLAMTDMLDEKTIWSHELSSGARLWPISADELGVMDRKGSFKVVAVADGALQLEAEVQPEPQLSEAYVFRSGGNYLLLTNSPHRPREGINVQPVQGGFQNPLINGHLYGFDRETKKQLYKVRIAGHGLTLYQPRESPMLVFASQIYETPRGGGNMRSPQGALLCIDKRNGRTIYDKRFPTAIQMIDIVGEPDRNAVTLKMMRNALRFTFTAEPYTDESKPPEPTDNGARSKEGAASEVGKAIVGGAAGVGEALQQAREALERQKALQKNPQEQPAPANPPAPRAEKEE
ncbi:MAG: PQQ-binding-like beta-propeller repeat protein [Planctomycetaceae bacterium]|nr:PQQ-binding-like beta-propeller repeat protein [Planctomycetaceae bacterium]